MTGYDLRTAESGSSDLFCVSFPSLIMSTTCLIYLSICLSALHIYIYISIYTHMFTHTYVYMVRRLAFPAPPPPNGMVWYGGGGGEGLACAERGGGGWSCSWRNGQASQTRPA